MTAVHASYYTDPACPWSWANEPALRRLEVEFGAYVTLEHVMGGLAREFGPPPGPAAEWLAAGEAGAMPVDPRPWLEAPPASSYPACLAVKAAGEQGPLAERAFLRRLREGFAWRRRKLDTAEAFLAEARAVTGLDVARFEIDLRSHAIAERFGADLDRAAAAAPPDRDRVRVPTLVLRGARGEERLEGFVSVERLARAAASAGAERVAPPFPSVEQALERFGALATAEVAAVCDLPGPRAPAELWRLASEWRVRAERGVGGEMWGLG